jgi:hypothetical protein
MVGIGPIQQVADGFDRRHRLLFHHPVAGIGDDPAFDIAGDETHDFGLLHAE